MRQLLLPLLLATAIWAPAQQRNQELHALFKDYFEDRLREYPEVATARGRSEYNNRWTDWSRPAIDRRAKAREAFLDRLRPFLTAKLSEQDNLSARFLAYQLEREAETEALDIYMFRMAQLFGAHVNVFRTIDVMPHNTVRDYENIVARLNATPVYVDQQIRIYRESIARGLVQPSVVVDRVAAQLRSQISQDPRSSDLLSAFRQWPAAIPEPERQRLLEQANQAFREAFLPAWRKLSEFVEKTYASKARPGIALSSVPDGTKLYAAQVRSMTTTPLTPEQIHELGKTEVNRLEQSMLAVARATGFQGSVHEYEQRLAASPDQRFRSKEEMLAYCRNAAKVIEPELPRLFKL